MYVFHGVHRRDDHRTDHERAHDQSENLLRAAFGDEGRSQPNVSEILGVGAICEQLDVVEVSEK